MNNRKESLVSACEEIIFTAQRGGIDIAQFGKKVADILYEDDLISEATYLFLTGAI